jgi:hypothetical protein
MRLKTLIVLMCLLVVAVKQVHGQSKDSFTIGNLTFDFAAPAPPLTAAQQAFFERYKQAVNGRDKGALLAMQDPSVSRCKYDGREFLLQNLRYTIPARVKVRLFPSADLVKAFGMGEMAYMPVEPTALLGVEYENSTKDHVSVVQIIQPIRESGGTMTLVPYCLTDKGEQMRRERQQGK